MLDKVDVHMAHAFYFLVNGLRTYRQMGLKLRDNWWWMAPAAFPWVFALDTAPKWLPGGDTLADRIGSRWIHQTLSHEDARNAPFQMYHV